MSIDNNEENLIMDCEPIQIIKIQKQDLRYDLNIEGLQRLLAPIEGKKIAVIPVIGQSISGKSFIANYMCRYLSDPKNADFIGNNDEPLKGFDWRPHVDPNTSGLWLSKPFIVRQSNGEEIAVLLMDSQGVFDRSTSDRDSITIFWICLLVSSCLVFNTFTTLSEDILCHLEPFLKYGSLFHKFKAGTDEEFPFQSLAFLIRDWNTSAQFSYGLSGGQKFLRHKLEIRDNQSPAVITRQLLRDSFRDLNCFLMPNIGPNVGKEDFNGCVDDLSPGFRDYLIKFFQNFLNADKIKSKMINNKYINGKELLQYFKVYVDLFNNKKEPKEMDIIGATTKTLDLILIESIKERNLNNLKIFIQTKHFISRNDLKEYNNQIRSESLNEFNVNKRSDFRDICKELNKSLNDFLNSNFDLIYRENEVKREEHMRGVVEDCEQLFDQLINKETKNKFFDSNYLELMFETIKEKVLQTFKQSFGDEEESLFTIESFDLNKRLINSYEVFRNENISRISEAERSNSESVYESIEYYKNEMQSMLDQNMFVTEEQFKRLEFEVKTNTRKYFKTICTSGDSKFIQKFDLNFRQSLSDLKFEFKQQNDRKNNQIIDSIEIDLIDSIEEYNHKMNELIETIGSEEELNESHSILKNTILGQFIDKNVVKDSDFLKPFVKTFQKNIENSKESKVKQLSENFKKTIEQTITESKQIYIKGMDEKFGEKTIYSIDDFHRLAEQIKNKTLLHFERHFNTKFGLNIDKYLFQLNQFISGKFDEYCAKNTNNKYIRAKSLSAVSNECFELYSSRMRAMTDSMTAESDLLAKHKIVMTDVIDMFTNANETTDKEVLKSYSDKLEKKIKSSLTETMKSMEKNSFLVQSFPNEFTYSELQLSIESAVNIIETSSDGKYLLNEKLLRSVVSKACDCDNFALISIIGQKFSGKSRFMNYLVDYLKSNNRNSWPKHSVIQSNEGFQNDSSDEELKPMVQMWSKPFILEADDQKTAVFLMDSSHVFNNSLEMSNTKLIEDIIGLFLKTSSTLIYLKETKFEREDIENFKSLVIEINRTSQMDSFQELFYIIRDWNQKLFEDRNYLFGVKGGDRYMTNEFGRHGLGNYFQNISTYLMPSAGRRATRLNLEFNKLDEQFCVELSNLITHKLLNIDEMQAKKDLKTNRRLRPEELIHLFRTSVDQLNGEFVAFNPNNEEMVESFENVERYESDESVRVLPHETRHTEECDLFDVDSDDSCD